MAFKDVLLVLTSYPDPTPISAIDQGIDFAGAIGAKMSAIACEIEFRVPGNILGNALLNVSSMAAAEAKKSSANAQSLLAAFQDSAAKHGVFQERIIGALSNVGGSRRARRACPSSRSYDRARIRRRICRYRTLVR